MNAQAGTANIKIQNILPAFSRKSSWNSSFERAGEVVSRCFIQAMIKGLLDLGLITWGSHEGRRFYQPGDAQRGRVGLKFHPSFQCCLAKCLG